MMSDLPPSLDRTHDTAAGVWRWHAVLSLAGGLLLLRAIYLPWINLFPEEAYYWNYSQHLDFGYLDHPPMVAWLIYLGVGCFGHHELGVRFFALVCSLVTSFFTFRLAALLYGRKVGETAVLLVQLLPFFFMSGWIMTPDAPLTACWAGTLYFLARVVFDGRARAWWGVGVCLGLGMLSKYTIALLGPATLLFLWLDPPSRGWFRRAAPYGSVLLAVAIFSPVLVWNFAHHWASFAFQSTGRLHESRRFALPSLAGSILLLLTPLGVVIVGQSLHANRDESMPQVRRRRFAWVFTLVPLLVFTVFSLVHRVKLNWTGPLWLAVLPQIAARLTPAMTAPAKWLRVSWLTTVSILIVGYTVLLQYLRTGLPGVPYASNTALLPVGWPGLSRSLERQKQTLRDGSPARVLIVGMDHDFLASEAAFYQLDQTRAVQETTGGHLFEGNSLMYAYWFPPHEQDGATLLLVSFRRNELKSGTIHRHLPSSRTHRGASDPGERLPGSHLLYPCGLQLPQQRLSPRKVIVRPACDGSFGKGFETSGARRHHFIVRQRTAANPRRDAGCGSTA